MRVCTTGEGSGSDLGAGGSGNEAGGGEMEYDVRRTRGGYWSECGKGGRDGAQWADRRWWETGGSSGCCLAGGARKWLPTLP
jgi:hypothetical protein